MHAWSMGSHVHGKSRPSRATCSRFAPACKCTHAQSTKEIGTEEGKHRNALKTFNKSDFVSHVVKGGVKSRR